jgi:transcriptional regulator with XRE-family HTH domain
MNNDKSNLGASVASRLKAHCADNGISTRDLATRLNNKATQKSVWNLLNNQHSPKLNTLEPVCKVLGISLAALVSPAIDPKLLASSRLTRLIEQYSRLTGPQRVIIENKIAQMLEVL